MENFNRTQAISTLIKQDIQRIRQDLDNDYEDGLIAILEFGFLGYRNFSDAEIMEEIAERKEFEKYGY